MSKYSLAHHHNLSLHDSHSPPLYLTVYKRFEATTWLLLENGTEVDAKNYNTKNQSIYTALRLADVKGDESIVRHLLENEASPTEKFVTGRTHTTLLHIAAAHRYTGIVYLLLE